MDFSTLKSRLLAQVGRAPSDVCYELVTADINNSLRLLGMEKTATVTEASTMTLPVDFLEMVDIYRDTDPRTSLKPTTPQALTRTHRISGTPCEYAVVDGAILLNPEPDGTDNVVLRYYAALPDLSADSDTNIILTKFPSVYIYGVLTHHAALTRDAEGARGWLGAYEGGIASARKADVQARMAGAPMQPVSNMGTP